MHPKGVTAAVRSGNTLVRCICKPDSETSKVDMEHSHASCPRPGLTHAWRKQAMLSTTEIEPRLWIGFWLCPADQAVSGATMQMLTCENGGCCDGMCCRMYAAHAQEQLFV
jgi:hypothetical protein